MPWLAASALAATNLSVWVYPGASGRLLYQPDFLGNRILDASGIGYKGGTVPLPGSNTVPVKATVSPVAGDNTANIQAAINTVSAMGLDANGFRGAVLLNPGNYPCSNTITISSSGVVLRGSGSYTNGTGTVLEATANRQYTLIEITGSGSASTVGGTTHTITNAYVPAGARSFFVDSTANLSVGDSVFVQRVATSNWIHDLGMDLLGPPPDVPWTPSGYNINMERVITHMEGNEVFVDAPITCAIDAHYTNGTISKFTWSSRIQNVGIEHIFAQSDYFGNVTNENHGWTFVQFDKVVNGWARDVASQYFGFSCVSINSSDKYITVTDSQSLDPISIITGGRRYAFVVNDAQYFLVKNCYTRQDRHQYVTQSLTIGPGAFVDGVSDNAHAEAGPHQRWATGILWDNITVHGGNLDIQNAGNYGTGHGWEGGSCTSWNGAANGFIVQNPPGAHNWLIGCVGPIQNGTAYVGPHAPGEYDSSGSSGVNVFPDSLYFNQLQDRLVAPNSQMRDYWLGVIDGFTNSAPGGDTVSVDSGWRASVQSAAGSQPLDAFDIVTNNHWVPFTFHFSLNVTEHIIGASLTLSMRATNSAAGDVLYLGSVSNSFTFSSLHWLPISTSTNGSNNTVRVLDLAGQLNLLTNGQLNAAVQGDIGVDWAMLELQVAPLVNIGITSLTPVADATVRGGIYAGTNLGTNNTLTVKIDSTSDNTRQAYLRWDLSGVTQSVYQARVALTPVSVGTNGVENGVAISANDTWSESAITWNNQPGGGERFATWIPAVNAPVSFDVTPQVLDALTGDKQLSLELFSVHNAGSNGGVDYASREYSDPNSRPQLLLTVLGQPPTISAISNRTVAVNVSTGPIPFTVGDPDSGTGSLVLNGASSDTRVVPNANIVLSGSGSNRTVTITPAANQSGAAQITITVSDPGGLSASTSFTLTVSSHSPAVIIWNGPGAGANNWSTSGNWLPVEVPEYKDDLKFYDPGAGGVAVSNINNFADANFGGTVASVQYANTNGNHTTLIGPGNTVNLLGTNGLIVGTETDNLSAQTVFATVTGSGGTLAIVNPAANLTVRQGSATNGSQRATLDLSGLGNFIANVNQVMVGVVGPINRATGTLYLGKTNTITATGSPGISAANNTSNNGGQNYIYLGQNNSIFADSIIIARQKGTGTLRFNPALANPSALFRASDGFSRVSTWNIADNSLQSTSSSSALGTNDFNGGTVDAMVDTMIVGKSQTTTGANSSGMLTFSSGTIDVNTLQIGFQAQSGAISAGIGRVNVNGTGAVLVVNTTLELGHTSGGAGASNTFGTLDINGGTVLANAIIAGTGSGSNTIAINGGTLALSGTAGSLASPISNVALTNATLQLSVAAGMTNLVAANLATGGATNLVAITAMPNLVSFPAQFALVKYSGVIAGAGFNFGLSGPLAGTYCGGYLSNNTARGSVDLVVTNCPVPDSFLTWDGTASGDWDMESANWKNNVATGLMYADGTPVVFNDFASGVTNVNLTQTLAPASVTVSNNARNYTFQGVGDLTGSASLTKQGPGTLILANQGTNDFTGGVTISGGTLQIGDGGADGNLPAGSIVDNASLVFDRGDNVTVPNTISGSGSLTQIGSGAVALSASNGYAGSTLVTAGTLALTGSGSISASSNITLAAGAILDVSARTDGRLTLASGQVLSGNGTINGSLLVGPGATVLPGGSIGSLTITNTVTLQSTVAMELNRSLQTNDTLQGALLINYGGTLALTNLSGTLTVGDSFKLFSAASYAGSFANLAPASPGSGLAWDTTGLTNGTLRIVVAPRPAITSITSADVNLVIAGTNGIRNGGYFVLSSTNVVLPLAAWTRLATNQFDASGNFNFTNALSPTVPQSFYLLQVQ